MTCDDAARSIAAAEGRGLRPDERRSLEAHLAECAACRAESRAQQDVAELLRARPALDASPAFTSRVLECLAAGQGWLDVLDFRKWTWRLLPAAAVLLIGALLMPSNRLASVASSQGPAASEPAIGIMESWVTPRNGSGLPATALLWQPNVSEDTLLVAVLTTSPDAELRGTSLGR